MKWTGEEGEIGIKRDIYGYKHRDRERYGQRLHETKTQIRRESQKEMQEHVETEGEEERENRDGRRHIISRIESVKVLIYPALSR